MKRKLKPFILFLIGIIVCWSCGKNKPNKTDLYLQVTIDGEDYYIESGAQKYNNGYGTSGVGSIPGYFEAWEESTFAALLNNDPHKSWTIGLIKRFPYYPSDTQLDSMYHEGTYPYGVSSDRNAGVTVDGARIEMYDESQVTWSTDLGTHDQTGSAFNVTSLTEGTEGAWYTMEATFNCKLYDESGNSKTLTNGEMRIRIGSPY